MMKHTHIVSKLSSLALLGMLALSSCEKKTPSSDNESKDEKPEVTTTTTTEPVAKKKQCNIVKLDLYLDGKQTPGSTRVFTYDDSKRVSQSELSTYNEGGKNTEISKYTYEKKLFSINITNPSIKQERKENFELDDQGRIAKITTGEFGTEAVSTFDYNADGNLIVYTITNYLTAGGGRRELTRSVITYSYTNGNVTRRERTSYTEGVKDRFAEDVVTYEYDTNKERDELMGAITLDNAYSIPLMTDSKGNSLMGKQSKNRLVKSNTTVYEGTSGIPSSTIYEYKENENKMVSSVKSTTSYDNKSTKQIREYRFEYKCEE